MYYIDKNTTEGTKKREQVYNNNEYVEEAAPLSAPDWTKLGYDSLLKNATLEAASKYRWVLLLLKMTRKLAFNFIFQKILHEIFFFKFNKNHSGWDILLLYVNFVMAFIIHFKNKVYINMVNFLILAKVS